MVEAAGPGQLPCSEKQVTNIRRTEKLKRGYSSDVADDLFVIMQRAIRKILLHSSSVV